MQEQGGRLRDLLAIWLISMANCHYAFAIEIATAAAEKGMGRESARLLIDIALAECRRTNYRPPESTARRVLRLCLPPLIPKLVAKVWPRTLR